uniref:Putative trypsin-like serine protease n=1 Tax=Ixodes ricinus TaxID=34613 RepID=V5H8V1_IXORI
MGSSYFAFVVIFSTLLRISITGPRNDDTLETDCGRRQQQHIVSERIVNGTTAHPDDWPWMVGLYTVDDKFYCGGVLISNQYVLTAAHCYKDQNTTGFLSVRLGSTNRTNFTVDCHRSADNIQNLERSDTADKHDELEEQVICMEVDDVCIPVQGNNCADFMIDLALLKLKRPSTILTKRIQPICLPEKLRRNCLQMLASMLRAGAEPTTTIPFPTRPLVEQQTKRLNIRTILRVQQRRKRT